MDAEALDNLQGDLRGRVVRRGDSDYDEARKLYNGMIDKRPAAIARCVDAADVITCVNFARNHGVTWRYAAAATTALGWAALTAAS